MMVRYHADRPTDLRRPSSWHRLSYITRAEPERLEARAGGLEVSSVQSIGTDLPGNPVASVEIAADGTAPVANASVDAVLSTQVLEHVGDPAVYLRGCFCVLRPGGRLLFSTHGSMVYQPAPVDLQHWTGAGLRRAVADARFEIRRCGGMMGLRASGLRLVQHAFQRRLPRAVRPPAAFVAQGLVRSADRAATPRDCRRNALVFALVAGRP